MNEQIKTNVANPIVFWNALRTWVKIVFLGGCLLLALFIWVPGFIALAPVGIFFFLGSNTAALVMKVWIIFVVFGSFVLVMVGITLILYLLAYGFCYLIVAASTSTGFADFIFKNAGKKEEKGEHVVS